MAYSIVFHTVQPVIVVTTIDEPDVKQAFAAQGVTNYVVKSDFERGNLIAEVNKLLANISY